VWWQEEIQCGQEWHGEIDRAIQGAGAIIVLWSKKSTNSIWVKHEASQAIAKSVYTPIRIELVEIESPYNRIQATDMLNWSGDLHHPGWQDLFFRLKQLIPGPIPFRKRLWNFILEQRLALLFLTITCFAVYLLLTQSRTLESQIVKQEEIFSNIQRTLQPLKVCEVFISDLEVPMSQNEFSDYKKMLDSGIKVNMSTYPKLEFGVNVPAVAYDKNGSNIPTLISFSDKSAYFPSRHQTLISGVISVSNISISIYKKSINPKEFEPFSSGGFKAPDLNINLYSHYNNDITSELQSIELGYQLEEKKYILSGWFISNEKQWKDNSRKIISLPDLDSVQIFLSIGPLGLSGPSSKDYLSLRRKFEFGSFSIKFNNTEVWINSKDLIKHTSSNGSVFWEFRYRVPNE